MARVFGFYCIAYSLLFLAKPTGNTMAASLNNTKSWAQQIGNNITQLFQDVTKYNEIKKKYSPTNLTLKERDGPKVAEKMKEQLESVLQSRIQTVKTLAKKAEELRKNYTYEKGLSSFQYYDSKYLLGENHLDLVNVPSFADKLINLTYSTVHIPTDVYNGSEVILNSAKWTQPMNKFFKENREQTPSLLWQLLGTSNGVYRFYPGYKWPSDNSNDFYDHRRRGWYIQGFSSPKDMVILLDLSGSMVGNKLAIVKLSATILLDTLQENDFVNIVTFNKGSRMLCEELDVIKNSKVANAKPCTKNSLLQATIQNKKYLKEMVSHVEANEVAEVSEGFKKAIDLLKATRSSNRSSTNCLRTINFFTDGVEETEGGKTMGVLNEYEAKKHGIRVFGYLVGREKGSPYKPVQKFACATKGYFYTIETLSDVRENVSNYLNVLSRPLALQRTKPNDTIPTWTPIYLDQLGLGLMITVVAPIYDAEKKDKLLGVVGTDVALPTLNDSVPLAEIGVNGYGFAINNNGFILFHPLLKEGADLFPQSYSSDDDSETVDSEDPPNLVLFDFNLEQYKEKLENLSRKLIDRETGSEKLDLREISKDLKRISPERSYTFYYTPIHDSSFSSAVVISEVGAQKLTPKESQRPVKAGLFKPKNDEILMVAPWKICKDIIPKARNTKPLFIPMYADAEDFAMLNDSFANKCNPELLDLLLFDAEQLEYVKFDVKENDTRGYLNAFVGTSGGFTKVLAPGQNSPVNRDVTHEPYYQRAADFNASQVVVSAPYMAPGVQNEQNDTIILTASSSVYVDKKALAAVVGMQMKDDVLKEVMLNNSECKTTSEEWSCFLIDEDGYVVASSTNDSKSEVGKHFGVVHGQVMQKMINISLFTKFTFNDTQFKCSKSQSKGTSSAMRLINPFLAVSSYVTWMTQTLFWSLVQFNIFSFFSGKSQAVAEEEASEKDFCTMNIPFFKANPKSQYFTEGYALDTTSCSNDDSCLSPFSVAPVDNTNLFLVTVKNCECKGKKSIRTEPKQVESVPFIAPAERYRRLPQLKCYASNANETTECGSGATLSPMKLLVLLLIPAYLFLVH